MCRDGSSPQEIRVSSYICVDLKRLNENVLHEVYPLPKVDQTLAQLSGATVFSRLDANSGYWQVMTRGY